MTGSGLAARFTTTGEDPVMKTDIQNDKTQDLGLVAGTLTELSATDLAGVCGGFRVCQQASYTYNAHFKQYVRYCAVWSDEIPLPTSRPRRRRK
jgi:hypothetical protein